MTETARIRTGVASRAGMFRSITRIYHPDGTHSEFVGEWTTHEAAAEDEANEASVRLRAVFGLPPKP